MSEKRLGSLRVTDAFLLEKKTKILTVIGTLDSGGCERHLLEVLPRLNGKSFDVRVFALGRRGALASEMENRGVRVSSRRWQTQSRNTSLARRIVGLGDAAFCFLRELSVFHPKIIHFFLPASYVLGAPLALVSGHKHLVMSRRSLANYQSKHAIAAYLERKLHPRMSLLLGNSRAVVKQLREESSGKSAVELIYNGIEVSDFVLPNERRAVRKNLGIDDQTVALGILANLIPYKGHADLLRACGRIESTCNSWKLFLIGRDDGIGSKLKALAASLGIAGRVVFLGERQNGRDLLGAMDIGVSASHEEGFSNAILEFMAAGVPVVATDVGGNAEAVIDGTSGLVVPVADHNRMAEALARLLQDSELRKRLGSAGHHIVREKFSISTCVAAYETMYKRIVAGEKSLCVV